MTSSYDQIISNPDSLNITNNIDSCPRCNSLLLKEVQVGKTCISECSECSYDDRPFGWCRRDKGPCTCVWKNVNTLYITCAKCSSPEEAARLRAGECTKLVQERAALFRTTWKTLNVDEKLRLYGIAKLRRLAVTKQIRGPSKYRKGELVALLTPLVTHQDFQIRY